MSFIDKNILIIGGSSGIGLNLIGSLSSQDATVYTASRSSSESWPVNVRYQQMDVLENPEVLKTFIPDQLNGLVYSVGNINLKPFSRLQADELIHDYRLNLVGAAMVIQQALPALKNAGSSSIVLISSVAATTGMSFHASIAAAKGAIESFAKALAAELAIHKIRVNVVAPSLTETPLAARFLNTPEKIEATNKRHPIGRFGSTDDISSAITFLLSEENSWITGQVLGVDGGIGSLRTAI